MQHLETCLPIVEAHRVLCRHHVMFLTVLFHWMYKIKYTAANIIDLARAKSEAPINKFII